MEKNITQNYIKIFPDDNLKDITMTNSSENMYISGLLIKSILV